MGMANYAQKLPTYWEISQTMLLLLQSNSGAYGDT